MSFETARALELQKLTAAHERATRELEAKYRILDALPGHLPPPSICIGDMYGSVASLKYGESHGRDGTYSVAEAVAVLDSFTMHRPVPVKTSCFTAVWPDWKELGPSDEFKFSANFCPFYIVADQFGAALHAYVSLPDGTRLRAEATLKQRDKFIRFSGRNGAPVNDNTRNFETHATLERDGTLRFSGGNDGHGHVYYFYQTISALKNAAEKAGVW